MAEEDELRPLEFPSTLLINWHLYPVFECRRGLEVLEKCRRRKGRCEAEMRAFVDCYLIAHGYETLDPAHSIEVDYSADDKPKRGFAFAARPTANYNQ